uniref:EAL domain-containing protein n=1 Tax=Treponema sp. TaxID=166 RepID=UPI00389029F0
ILILGFILTKTLLKRLQGNIEAQFIEQCDSSIDDYELAVESKLKQIESRLDIFYAKIAYKTLSIKEITDYLLKEKEKVLPPFHMVVYANKDGHTWNSAGDEYDVTDRAYFYEIMSGNTDFFVSSVLDAKHDGKLSLVFARPVFNEDNQIIGALIAVAYIEDIRNYFEEISPDKNKRFVICDKNRRFIFHYDSKWINWTFTPWMFNEKVLKAGNESYNVIETNDTNDNPVYLFTRECKTAPWLLGYSVPVSEFTNLRKAQASFQNFILEIIAIVLGLIFLLEIWIHSVLERHQILSTNIDSVTHLWTHSFFEKEVNKLLHHYPNLKFMMIESDMHGFKFINQNFGEAKANKILYTYSRILYESCKSFDSLLSRGYADHFYIFLKIESVHKAMAFFKQALVKFTGEVRKNEIPLTPKFGISFYLPQKNEKDVTAQSLITQANFAKNTIKENALYQYAIYDEKLLQQWNEDNFIETHMEEALLNNEFFVMYQPKIDLATEKVVGAEALVRWQSSELGFVAPNDFIPLFEKNNFVIKLDFYVYEQVFKFLKKCIDNNSPVVPISVNVSRNHDKPDKFVYEFTNLLKKYDIPVNLIEVELLERASLDKNLLRDITILLQKEGLRVAIDDFGSGESSLNMLSSIPANILKFDRSFLFAKDEKNGTLDVESENFIETLVGLGKNLKKETIFEGVETQEQRDFLKKIKCDQVQGYFYSKPLREDEYMEFLKNHR